jgi:hypothetical protein
MKPLPNDPDTQAEELLELKRAIADKEDRIESLKIKLREHAKAKGESLKFEFPRKGVVYVAPPKEGEFKGLVPELKIEAWLELAVADQERLKKKGLVEVAPRYGRPFYGNVKIELL